MRDADCKECKNKFNYCVECTNDDCSKCEANRVEPSCNCEAGYVEVGGKCEECNYNCASCSTSPSQCVTCAGSQRINPDACECPAGYFDNGLKDVECF